MTKLGEIVGTNRIILNQDSILSIFNDWIRYRFNNSEVTAVTESVDKQFIIDIKEKSEEYKPCQ